MEMGDDNVEECRYLLMEDVDNNEAVRFEKALVGNIQCNLPICRHSVSNAPYA